MFICTFYFQRMGHFCCLKCHERDCMFKISSATCVSKRSIKEVSPAEGGRPDLVSPAPNFIDVTAAAAPTGSAPSGRPSRWRLRPGAPSCNCFWTEISPVPDHWSYQQIFWCPVDFFSAFCERAEKHIFHHIEGNGLRSFCDSCSKTISKQQTNSGKRVKLYHYTINL